MKNTKRILALVLSILMVVSLFAGCGAEEEPVDDNKVEISLGIYPATDESAQAMHDGFIETLTKQYADEGIELTITPAAYDYAVDTFVAMAEAETIPTVFTTWFTEPQKLIDNEYVADITDELETLGWADMAEGVKSLLSDEDGNVYGVPRDSYALGLMINADLFAAAGLVDEDGVPTFPQTWQDVADYGVKIKEATGAAGICLLGAGSVGGWHFSNIAWNFGSGDLVTDNGDGTYTANLNTQGVKDAMQFVSDLKWKYDILTADPLSEDWATGFMQIGTGNAAMYLGANDAVAQPTCWQAQLPATSLALGAVPAGPKGDQYSLYGGTPYMFSASASEEQIIASLKYLETAGAAPVISDGTKEDFAWRVENNVPVIQNFPTWDDAQFNADMQALVDEYTNVDARNYAEYFEAVTTSGNLHPEEPGDTQEMYRILGSVMEEVLTNQAADISALLDAADAEYQDVLDDM